MLELQHDTSEWEDTYTKGDWLWNNVYIYTNIYTLDKQHNEIHYNTKIYNTIVKY